jgi:hypothetical protein
MTTGRINQVTFHRRRSSAARDWAASATFEARSFHFTLFRSRGRTVSLVPSVFYGFVFSRFSTPLSAKPCSSYCPSSICQSYILIFRTFARTVSQNQIIELSHPHHFLGFRHTEPKPCRDATALDSRLPFACRCQCAGHCSMP